MTHILVIQESLTLVCLPCCIESCMCPRMSERAQDISASKRTTSSLLFLLGHDFCHSCLSLTLDPSPSPMKPLNYSCMLYVSMCTLKIQLYLQAQVLHVRKLCWDSQEDILGRTSLRCTCSGKSNLPNKLFHSEHKIVLQTNPVS